MVASSATIATTMTSSIRVMPRILFRIESLLQDG